ncbi:MAG: glycosyltransferase family 2 protein, partial [Chitinophagaceae bacterium]|nr:glycosyltransferase family 2 protein [Chitinophagaceae bacterium]
MEKLSVVVITYNEELNIGRCLASVQTIADEIVVLDSFSDDQTISIARQYGARVWQEPFKGYIQQKNRALELATYPFVLSLDGDEEINATLKAAILACKKHFTFSGYRMKRCTNYCGQFIRHG